MEYLNIRLTQPMIGMHTRLGQLEAHATPARLHSENRQARSNVGIEQSSISINTYPSRHSYGFTNHADFAKEHGEQGFSDLAKATSGHTQEAWQYIDNAARPGSNEPAATYTREVWSQLKKQRQLVAELIPDPEIHGTPARIVGDVDPGDVTVHIDTDAFAKTHFTPGQVEVYMKQKGEVRQWVTEGHYDRYA